MHASLHRITGIGAIAVSLAATLAAAPAFAQSATTINARAWTRYALSNGLDVILEERHDTPRVAVEVDYHVGTRDQTDGYSGLAHMCEHMMFEWARATPRGSALSFLDTVGTEAIVGETSLDVTRYAEVISASMLERVIAFESDRMGFLLDHVTAEQLEAQRLIVLREHEERELRWGARGVFANVTRAMYGPTHPFRFAAEDLVDAQLLSLDNVRWFHQRWYTPSNATLIIVGDFETARVRPWIERYFGGLARVPRPVRAQAPVSALASEQRIVTSTYARQDRLFLSWHSPPYFADGDAELDLVADVLSGSGGGRLAQRVEHDNAVALAVGAEQHSQLLTSTFVVAGRTQSNAPAEVLLAHVDAELERLRARPIPEQDLQNLRATRLLAMREWYATLSGRAFALGSYARLGGSLEQRMTDDFARYDRVTTDSMRRAVQRWLSPTQRVVAIVRALPSTRSIPAPWNATAGAQQP